MVENLVKNHSKPHKREMVTEEYVRSKIFEKIHYKRILDNIDLTEFIGKLSKLLKEQPRIKLIMFDSFPTHFRNIVDQKNINKILNEISMKLQRIAKKYKVCVKFYFLLSDMIDRVYKYPSLLAAQEGFIWGVLSQYTF